MARKLTGNTWIDYRNAETALCNFIVVCDDLCLTRDESEITIYNISVLTSKYWKD